MAELFELPAETAGVVKVTVTGKSRVLIENHKGILEYSRERIEVAAAGTRVAVNGQSLELAAMDRGAVMIKGRIMSVEYM